MAIKESIHSQGAVKAAILLLSLEYEQSAEIMKLLTDEQVRVITEAIAELDEVTPDETTTVLQEFVRISGYGSTSTGGGFARARRIVAAAFGKEAAKRLTERLPRPRQQSVPDLSSLEDADPESLANFLGTEHPQTIALVLAHLKPDKSSEILQNLPNERRVEIALRLASLDRTSPNVVGRVMGLLDQKLRSVGGPAGECVGGVRAVADLLNRVDSGLAEEVLSNMEQKDEKTATQIRDLLFVFEDLSVLDDQGLKELIGKVDRKTLTMALKGTSEELQAHIFKTMSKRGTEMMREDMEALGPVKIRDVETAQKEIIQLARSLEKQGVLSLSSSETEQYVV